MKLKSYFICFLFVLVLLLSGCPDPIQPDQGEPKLRVEIPTLFSSRPEGDGGPVNILILCETDEAVFKYTTDGTTPSSNHGLISSGSITIYESCTVKVVATKPDMTDSEVVSESFVVTKTAMPQFNYNSGDYAYTLDVVITCGTPGAEIWYTTDGTDPSKSNGQKYTSAIPVSEPLVLKAIAYTNGMADSAIKSVSYSFSYPMPINNDVWKTGILNAGKTVWYYFDVTAGERYEIKWNDSKEGTSEYTGDIKVTTYRQNQIDNYFYSVDSGFNTPKVFTAAANERVYVKVVGYYSSSAGSFALRFKHIPPIQLADNQWSPNAVSYGGEAIWYYFEATAGEIYEIGWDDSTQGSGSYTCDIKATAYREDKSTTYFYGIDKGYSSPRIIKALGNERVYIKVEGYNSTYTGTFAVKYMNIQPVPLTNAQWTEGSLDFDSDEAWYYFDATAGSDYEIKWNEAYVSGSPYTCDIKVSAYRQDKTTSFFTNESYGYSLPKIMTAVASERVYIRVQGNFSTNTGTFALRYRAITILPLANDQWTEGNISNGDDVWFYFDASAGTKYEISWDDNKQGSSTYTSDIKISAYENNKLVNYFSYIDNGYTTPQTISVKSNEKVYVRVIGFSASETGTFALKQKRTVGAVSNPHNNVQSGVTEDFAPNESWTFMVYLDADNNLEAAGIADFNEMISGLNGLNNSNINVVVLIDRISGYSTATLGESSDWTGARLYQMNQDGTYSKKTDGWFSDGSEINMGDPNTLSSFINYCKINYASQHYALIMWNHGGGARSKSIGSNSNSVKAVCWDDTNSNDCLYLQELQQVVSGHFDTSSKLDFIGFDACLMGTVEVAYELRDLAKVMVGSMANEWGNGWDYNLFFGGMTEGANNDPKELGKLTVKMYRDSTQGQVAQTQSAIDLEQIATIKPLIDAMGVAIYQENKKTDIEFLRDQVYHFYSTTEDSIAYPYYDLCDLAYQIIGNADFFSANLLNAAQAVIDALSNIIIAAYAGSDYGNYYGVGSAVKRGLSIFFSRGNLIYDSNSHYRYQWWYTNADTNAWNAGFYFGFIDFANSDTDGVVETWRELMEAWYDPAPSNYTPGRW